LYGLPAGYYEDYIERVTAVTLDAANEAIVTRLSEQDLLVTVVGTAAQIADAVRNAVGGLSSSEVVPYDAEP